MDNKQKLSLLHNTEWLRDVNHSQGVAFVFSLESLQSPILSHCKCIEISLSGHVFRVYYDIYPSLVAQTVKNLPSVQKTWLWSLGWEDLLENGMATHSSILAWRIIWTEEPGLLQSVGSQRVRHHWGNLTRTQFTQTGVNQIKFSREMDVNNFIKCCSFRGTQGSKYRSVIV